MNLERLDNVIAHRFSGVGNQNGELTTLLSRQERGKRLIVLIRHLTSLAVWRCLKPAKKSSCVRRASARGREGRKEGRSTRGRREIRLSFRKHHRVMSEELQMSSMLHRAYMYLDNSHWTMTSVDTRLEMLPRTYSRLSSVPPGVYIWQHEIEADGRERLCGCKKGDTEYLRQNEVAIDPQDYPVVAICRWCDE